MKRIACLLLMSVGLWTTPVPADDRLQGPLDCARIRSQWGRAAPSSASPAVPLPVHVFRPPSFYSDDKHAAGEPARREEDNAVGTPLIEFEKDLNRLGDAYLQSSPADGADALAVMNWLLRWAQEDALNGPVGQVPHAPLNREGAYHQEWFLVTVSLNYLKIRDDPHLSPDMCRRVETWIGHLGTAVKDRYNPKKGNHHLYWAAAGVTLAGVATGDHRMFDWGIEAAGQGIKEITPEGYLPQELNRGTLASHYHAFAMLPLLLVAETAFRNGIDVYSQNGGGLHRLARTLMNIERNPQYLQPVIGLEQAVDAPGDGLSGAWWEIYQARFAYVLPDFRDVEQAMAAHRPYRYDWAGGNATLEFGVP